MSIMGEPGEGNNIQKLGVLSAQFFCKLKVALRIKSIIMFAKWTEDTQKINKMQISTGKKCSTLQPLDGFK